MPLTLLGSYGLGLFSRGDCTAEKEIKTGNKFKSALKVLLIQFPPSISYPDQINYRKTRPASFEYKVQLSPCVYKAGHFLKNSQ